MGLIRSDGINRGIKSKKWDCNPMMCFLWFYVSWNQSHDFYAVSGGKAVRIPSHGQSSEQKWWTFPTTAPGIYPLKSVLIELKWSLWLLFWNSEPRNWFGSSCYNPKLIMTIDLNWRWSRNCLPSCKLTWIWKTQHLWIIFQTRNHGAFRIFWYVSPTPKNWILE